MTQTDAIEKPQPAADLGPLPGWDLGDLYRGPDDAQLQADLSRSAALAAGFAAKYQGRVAELGGDELAAALRDYEAMEELAGKIMSFAGLYYAADVENETAARLNQTCHEALTAAGSRTLFFTLEINRLDQAVLDDKLKSPALAHYAPWLRDVRAFRDHQLSDDLEKLLLEKQVAGRAAWNRLFDETMAALRFPFGEDRLSQEEIFDRMVDKNPEIRKQAAQSLAAVFKDNVKLLALITNTLAKDKEIDDRWRGFKAPADSRHLSNHVEAETVNALVTAVRAAYPRLSHRYYKLKAKWFGQEQLNWWDRNAPLPQADDSLIPWASARQIVLDAYGDFSPDLAGVGRRFFDNAWIDAPVRPGKSSGAFAHPTIPSAHPYLLLNYQGKVRDVMTLAHELGHGVHQVLAGRQGALMADTPLTLAETASVFGEMLTFQALLRAETEPARRRQMLASKVEDMLNTVVRQIAFYSFEEKLHAERRDGELPADRIGDIWMEAQAESLGEAIRLDEDYRVFWCYIPHFIHSPFYVYAYAFGDCLVNSLYAAYADAPEGFAGKYLDLLAAGGTKRHKDLLAPFGLDATDPAFWGRGLAMIEGFIDQLEAQEAAL